MESGIKTPLAGEDDDEMSHSGDELMDDDESSVTGQEHEDEGGDAEMTFLEEESPIERLLQLSREISEDTTRKSMTNNLNACGVFNLGNETIYTKIITELPEEPKEKIVEAAI